MTLHLSTDDQPLSQKILANRQAVIPSSGLLIA
jgi:hypothetical protein